MNHPFANTHHLTPDEIQRPTGAGLSGSAGSHTSDLSPHHLIRPPVMTTMAIGEEGGGLGDLEIM